MDTTLTFEQAARIVGVGLNLDLLDREEVIVWAERQIAELSAPPTWLLELSTSRKLNYYDAAKLALENVPPASPELVAGVLLALMTPLKDVRDDALQGVAGFLYHVAQSACSCDWSHQILCDIDQISDNFALLRLGYLPDETEATLKQDLQAFFTKYSLPLAAEFLSPVKIPLVS